MIKRIYPRMSTADFVARSVAIHGNLYDYSESIYRGLKRPFSFLCNRCKTRRTLSQAGTHIRKNKPCGCKPCNHEKLAPCKICGVDVSSKVYQKQNKKCKECQRKHRESINDPWVLLAKREIRRNCLFDAWERKCRYVVGSLRRREKRNKQKPQPSFQNWEEKAKNQIRRCVYDKDYTAWELKCMTAFKGLKKRKLKNHRSDQY